MEFDSCAVCGRTILRGERSLEYVDDQGQEATVCPLCTSRTQESGLVPAALAAADPPSQPRRRGGATALRERFVRALSPPPPEPSVALASLEAFNASPEVRKVAGLRRSLGEPRVCVRAEARGGGEVVIVAWDLSWYRWGITGDAVKQLAKGNEISELPVEDRDWNATAAADGTLARA